MSPRDRLVAIVAFLRRWLPGALVRLARRVVGRARAISNPAPPGQRAGRALVHGALQKIRERGSQPVPDGGPIAVLAYHPRIKTNPYQRMLYARCLSSGIVPVSLSHLDGLADAPQVSKVGAVPILHMHWTHKVLEGVSSESEAAERIERFGRSLDSFRASGGRVSWTLHNVLPHETRFGEHEAAVCQTLADRCDAIHVMCETTAEMTAPYYTVPVDRLHVIPHASYLGVYPNFVDQVDARARLGLAEGDTVLTVFGGIRGYKGIGMLLDSFDAASAADPTLRLVIAGRPIAFDVTELRGRCDANPSIRTAFSTIEDEQVQVYLNAADVVVLPHSRVLNSGLLGLAQAFARPVIAPRTGCIAPHMDETLGILFDPEDQGSLERALTDAHVLKEGRYRAAARERAKRNSPAAMATAFAAMIRGLVR